MERALFSVYNEEGYFGIGGDYEHTNRSLETLDSNPPAGF